MKKSKAIIVLIGILASIGLLGYASIVGIGPGKFGSAAKIKQGLDLAGGVSITYQATGGETPSDEDMKDTIYKLQKRVETYSTEAQVYQEGNDRINIEIPGVSDANTILEDLGKPGSLYFISETDSKGAKNYSYSADADGNMVTVLQKSIEELEADGSIALTGTDVKEA